jgi:hypothetical protein
MRFSCGAVEGLAFVKKAEPPLGQDEIAFTPDTDRGLGTEWATVPELRRSFCSLTIYGG